MNINWFRRLPLYKAKVGMIDPPWQHVARSSKGVTEKSAGGKYDTMPMHRIKQLPVYHLFDDDAVLWCWGTHALIDQQIECVRAWGFDFSTTGVWVKFTVNGKLSFGTGQRLRCASEPFIIATKGAPRTTKSVRTVIEGPLREHSRKPDEAYAAAEQLMPGHDIVRYDIFSRESRPGWTTWGRERTKFDPKSTGAKSGLLPSRVAA